MAQRGTRPQARLLMALLTLATALPLLAAPASTVSHGRFSHVVVHRPDGVPQRVVVWFEQTPQASAAAVEALRADGALVAVAPVQGVRQALAAEHAGACAFGSGDVENFSRWLQAFLQLPGYRLPVLGGDGEGASLAYALAAQAPSGTLAGVLGQDFRPGAPVPLAVCGAGVAAGHLQPAPVPVPWLVATTDPATAAFVAQVPLARTVALSRRAGAVPGLRAAARVLGAQPGVALAPPPASLQGLPVVEVPAQVPGDTLAVFLSGDGGWAGLDKDVAAALAKQGVAVVGLDSLRYFWSPRTPQGVAVDLQRIIDHYRQQWQRPRVMLIGFSQGADVLPASINQLQPAQREALQRIVLMSMGARADFEFHVANWLSSSDSGLPITPEVLRLPAARTLCLYGTADADALCPSLPASAGLQRIALPGDHHFNGDHDRLAALILKGLGTP